MTDTVQELLDQISECIQQGDMTKVMTLAGKALDQKIDPKKIIDDGLMVGMNIIGVKFSQNIVFVPEMLVAARAMNKALEILEPVMVNRETRTHDIMVLGTVKGDLHDIGKNLISISFKAAGFHVVDLGVNVDTERFIEGMLENKANLIGLSALLTTTMVNMEETIMAIKAANSNSRIIVGGAPLTEKFALEIGADAYAADGVTAVKKARQLLNKRP